MADEANVPEDTRKAELIFEPHVVVDGEQVTVQVRRSPKYTVFLVLGAALGMLVALILTFAVDSTGAVSPSTGLLYSQGQVFGFLSLACVATGVLLAGAVALILDRTMGRRTRSVVADRDRDRPRPVRR